MPDVSSAKGSSPVMPVMDLTFARRLTMVLCGYIPCLHAAGVVSLLVLPTMGWMPLWTLALAPAVLYIVPPLVVRLTSIGKPPAEGRFSLDSPELLRWWFYAQWQVIFNRLDFLEEALRLVPGLYSLWLRLWGTKIGSLVYWSPGCRILDRPGLEVGSRVVFGAAVRLHGHIIWRNSAKKGELLLAPIRIGDDALIGGVSLLTPGVRVHCGEQTSAGRPIAPFTEFQDGQRRRMPLPAESISDDSNLRNSIK